MILRNGSVYTENCSFEPLTIKITNNRITAINQANVSSDPMDSFSYDATGCYVLPGLMDIHFHGCMGYDFCDGTKVALDEIISYQLKSGITSLCPATMTLPFDRLSTICENAASYVSSNPDCPIIGINLEGPFISREKKGAQNPAYIQNPYIEFIETLNQKSHNLIKMIAIAPETPDAMDVIKKLSKKYTFSIAHTTANYATSINAFSAGASHVTHLYNAMPPFHHRDSGVIGAAFDTPDCHVELICDGIHITPPVVRATFQLFGKDRIVLISDSMMATGMVDGVYSLGGQEVRVYGNTATLNDGTIAGSVRNLYQCMIQAIAMGIRKEDAIAAATINPARSIGVEADYGSIQKGKIANLLILNSDLSIKDVIFNGQILKFN